MKDLIKKAKIISSKLPDIKFAISHSNSLNIGEVKIMKKGTGDEFFEYKDYLTGDPLKNIDWKKSAKIQKLLIKNKEHESSRNIWFWIDNSISMKYGNFEGFKSKYYKSIILGLVLIDLSLNSGEKVGIIGSEIGLKKNKNDFVLLATSFIKNSYTLNDPRIKKNDIVIIFSDLLERPETYKKKISNMSQNFCHGIIIQILHPYELSFPFKGRKRFFDPVSGLHKLFNKTENVKEVYKAEFNKHQKNLNEVFKRIGWRLFTNITNSNYEKIIYQLYNK
tara:strand:+ start:3887 stop:4720 length:834 start_codon:yes stop_codon:yes gene_type:complete